MTVMMMIMMMMMSSRLKKNALCREDCESCSSATPKTNLPTTGSFQQLFSVFISLLCSFAVSSVLA